MIKYDEMSDMDLMINIIANLKDDISLEAMVQEIYYRLAVKKLAVDSLEDIDNKVGKLSTIEEIMNRYFKDIKILKDIKNKHTQKVEDKFLYFGEPV